MKSKKLKIDKFKKSGFTLLEVLIATMIFSTVMVITTGTVSQSIRYQNKLAAVRVASQESSRIADQISRDIRSANTEGQITFERFNPDITKTYKNGLAIVKYVSTPSTDSGYWYALNSSPSNGIEDLSTGENRAIVIFIKNNSGITAKVYLYDFDGKKIYYKNFGGLATPSITSGQIFATLTDANVIAGGVDDNNKLKKEMSLEFGGYAPSTDSTNKLQPYIMFELSANVSASIGSDIFKKSTSTIKSTVTSRSYNY